MLVEIRHVTEPSPQLWGLGCSEMAIPSISWKWRLRLGEARCCVLGTQCSHLCLLPPSPAAQAAALPDVAWMPRAEEVRQHKTGGSASGHCGASVYAQAPPAQPPVTQGKASILHPGLRAPHDLPQASSLTVTSQMPLLPPCLPTHPSLGSSEVSGPCAQCPNSVLIMS